MTKIYFDKIACAEGKVWSGNVDKWGAIKKFLDSVPKTGKILECGAGIPIEQRAAEEVTTFAKNRICPDGICVENPAFDVTDAKNITAIITDKGVIERPNAAKIRKHLA